MRFWADFRENICFPESFRENLCFPESFRENMCKKGANARGSFKKLAVFVQIWIISRKFSWKQNELGFVRENFREMGHDWAIFAKTKFF